MCGGECKMISLENINELANEMIVLGNMVVAIRNCKNGDCADRLFKRIVWRCNI